MSGKRPAILSRRALVAAAGIAVLSAGAALAPRAGAEPKRQAGGDDVTRPGPRGDIVLGDPAAPITMIEYASLTCPACARFHNEVLPALKKKYVDTGRVKLVLRELPTNNLAAAAAMLARCVPAEKAPAVIARLFETQDDWAFGRDNRSALAAAAEIAGIAPEVAKRCTSDQRLLDDIRETGERGKRLGVDGTPGFFINGRKFRGHFANLADFEAALAPLLRD